MVLNARIDVFIRAPDVDQGALLSEALARATAYLAAGVDCVYPIALRDRAVIEAFVEGASGAVNVLASPAAPPIVELAAIGVARISYGSSIHDGLMDELIGFLEGRRDRLGGAAAPLRPRAEHEDA
jgi:2-methylisocitrate lyase-like PEP mutase family enzyme